MSWPPVGRCVAVLVIASLFGLAAADCGTTSGPGGEAGSSSTTSGARPFPSGRIPIPLSARINPQLFVSGRMILVIGGERRTPGRVEPLGDGALYDGSSGRWLPVPAPPVGGTIYRPDVAWFDGGFLVAGNLCAPAAPGAMAFIDVCRPRTLQVARFDVGTRRWARLPEVGTDMPADAALVHVGPLAVTRRGIVAEIVHPYQLFREYKILSEPSGRWEKFPDPPLDVDGICGSALGLAAVDLFGSIDRPPDAIGLPQQGSRQPAAVAISGAGAWSRLPPDATLLNPSHASRIVCGGASVAVVSSPESGNRDARVLDLATRSWSKPSPVPPEASGTVLLAGNELAFVGTQITFGRAGRTWRTAPSPFGGAHRLAGGDGFVVGLWHDTDMYLRVATLRRRHQ